MPSLASVGIGYHAVHQAPLRIGLENRTADLFSDGLLLHQQLFNTCVESYKRLISFNTDKSSYRDRANL